jgi:hypothetical protein
MSINARQGHQGFYRIPVEKRFWAKVDRRSPDECWLWRGAIDTGGYGYISITHDGVKRNGRAHRIAWELHHGRPFPEGMFACHSCDNRPCVNPHHIWPGTNSDNMLDAVRKGRSKPMPPTKLKPDDVRAIRGLLANGDDRADVARRFGVHHHTIRRIATGQTWGDCA